MTDTPSRMAAPRDRPDPLTWSDRFRAAMLGGAVGDALGAAVRDQTTQGLRHRFGAAGVTEMLPAFGRRGASTELTQLTLFTLEALLRAKAVRGDPGDRWLPTEFVRANHLRWLYTQGVPWEYAMSGLLHEQPRPQGWLLERPELFSTRNPAGRALRGLGRAAARPDGFPEPPLADEGIAECVVWAAPAMVWGGADGAVFTAAADVSYRLTSDPDTHGASGLHAEVLAQLIRGVGLWDAVRSSESAVARAYRERTAPVSLHRTIRAAMFAAQQGRRPDPDTLDIEFDTGGRLGELGVALAAVASTGSVPDAVLTAVNQSADSSVTGALAGQLAGAIHGPEAIPAAWRAELELGEIVETLCADAAEAFAPPPPPPPLPRWAQRYVTDTRGAFSGPLELEGVDDATAGADTQPFAVSAERISTDDPRAGAADRQDFVAEQDGGSPTQVLPVIDAVPDVAESGPEPVVGRGREQAGDVPGAEHDRFGSTGGFPQAEPNAEQGPVGSGPAFTRASADLPPRGEAEPPGAWTADSGRAETFRSEPSENASASTAEHPLLDGSSAVTSWLVEDEPRGAGESDLPEGSGFPGGFGILDEARDSGGSGDSGVPDDSDILGVRGADYGAAASEHESPVLNHEQPVAGDKSPAARRESSVAPAEPAPSDQTGTAGNRPDGNESTPPASSVEEAPTRARIDMGVPEPEPEPEPEPVAPRIRRAPARLWPDDELDEPTEAGEHEESAGPAESSGQHEATAEHTADRAERAGSARPWSRSDAEPAPSAHPPVEPEAPSEESSDRIAASGEPNEPTGVNGDSGTSTADETASSDLPISLDVPPPPEEAPSPEQASAERVPDRDGDTGSSPEAPGSGDEALPVHEVGAHGAAADGGPASAPGGGTQRGGGHAAVEEVDAVAPSLTERVLGSLLGGALGDALGSALETMPVELITERFGPDGPTELPEAYGVRGAVTDDTQLTLFTAEGLIRGGVARRRCGREDPVPEVQLACQRWLHTQGVAWESAAGPMRETHPQPDGWLICVPGLFAARSPSRTVLRALDGFGSGARLGSISEPVNDAKDCGAVTRVAPAALWSSDPAEVFELAARTSALTHGHPGGYLSAGAFAVIVQQAVLGRGLDDGVWLALQVLETWEGHEETSDALATAVDLAAHGVPGPDRITEALGAGQEAQQALAIAVCATLAAGDDVELALRTAVRHSGDSAATGALCGNITGALAGIGGLPVAWLADLELRDVVEQVAMDCVAEFDRPPEDEAGTGAQTGGGPVGPGRSEAQQAHEEDWGERYPVRADGDASVRRAGAGDGGDVVAEEPATRMLPAVDADGQVSEGFSAERATAAPAVAGEGSAGRVPAEQAAEQAAPPRDEFPASAAGGPVEAGPEEVTETSSVGAPADSGADGASVSGEPTGASAGTAGAGDDAGSGGNPVVGGDSVAGGEAAPVPPEVGEPDSHRPKPAPRRINPTRPSPTETTGPTAVVPDAPAESGAGGGTPSADAGARRAAPPEFPAADQPGQVQHGTVRHGRVEGADLGAAPTRGEAGATESPEQPQPANQRGGASHEGRQDQG